jgi:HK97 family phage portal protein
MNFLRRLRYNTARWLVRDFMSQHDDLSDREHIWSVRQLDEAIQKSHYGRAKDDYAQHVWVQKAVKIWADSIGPLQIQVLRKDTVLQDHPLVDLLGAPNPAMSRSDVWRQWAVDMALGGECGFEAVRGAGGNIVQLYPRQPDFFHVRAVRGRERYFEVAEYVLDPTSLHPYTLPPDDFLHFKFYNPLNPFRGLPPAAAVRMSILIDTLIQSWSRMFFRNNARPDFAVIAPQGITPEEKLAIVDALTIRYGSVEQSHKPIVLEQGVQDIKPFAFPRKDLEWMQQRRLNRDEIGAIWGVPDEIMGYGRDTYENFDTAERVLWTLTLINLTNFRDEHLTRYCRRQGLLARGQRVATDLSRVWALRRAAAVQLLDAKTLFDMGVPFNVLDEKLGLGIGPVEGGDVGHVGSTNPFGTSGGSKPAPSGKPDKPSSEQEKTWQLMEALNGNGRH